MRRKRVLYAVILTLAAAVLMGTGLLRVVRVYQNYRTDMLTYESRHLNSIVSSSARGLDWVLGGYSTQIELLTERREFSAAEEEYLATGDGRVMRQLMARPDVQQFYMGYRVAAYDADGAFLAATSMPFPEATEQDEDIGNDTYLRTNASGEFWFVFTEHSDSGFTYELAVPVQTVFAYHADAVRVGRHGYLFLLDADNRFISYSGGGESATVSVQSLAESDPNIEISALEELSHRGRTSPEEYTVFRYPWQPFSASGRTDEQTLVVTSPLMTGGSLVLGAAMSFQEFDSFLTDTLYEVAGVIFLEIGGALILFFLAAWALIANRRNALELEVVREKADLMEEINRQQQSLAHTERLQQLGVMTSGIVHEFNNMLTPIMGQSLLLLEQLADQEASPQFENALDIYEASENARDMLRRMSSMSKKDVDMGFHTLELGALLQKTMNLASMAKDPHIRQELITPAEPLYVEGNEQLLVQAFLNLCINACQAMGAEGTLSVRASVEPRHGRDYAKIEVCDTGPGIPEQWFGAIYDSFFTTKGEQGTGLGLTICQKIIQSHKGTIAAANREAGGAVFTVRIPLCEPSFS